jgi:hypothetical protein
MVERSDEAIEKGYRNIETVRREVASGLAYTHSRANSNTAKLLEVSAFAYAVIELLAEKGLLSVEELDERKKVIADRLTKKFADQGMGVARQEPEHDKYTFQNSVRIDCENRLHLCKAACCRMRFALSKQDVEEGVLKWDFARPYLIARGSDGYCTHLDRAKSNCSVHSQRPVPCRAYDCRNDKRIWADFANRVISPGLAKLVGLPEDTKPSED